MDRLVDWQPVGAASSKTNVAAVEIVGIRINEAHVTMGKPFAADEDWLDKLTFRIRNTSDKTISAFWFKVAFPETDLPNGGYAGIGILFDAKKSSDQGKRISPGGEMDVDQYLGNYKPVNGMMFAFSIDTKVNGQSVNTITIDKIELDVPVDDALFKMPAKPAEKPKTEEKKPEEKRPPVRD